MADTSHPDAGAGDGVRVIRTADEAFFAAEELAALWSKTAAAVDAERRVPRDELRALRRSGLLGITVPTLAGGSGLPNETLVRVFLLLAEADVSLAQIPQNHYDFVDTLLYAAPDTRAFFYAEVLAGARFGNAIAEPGRPSRRELATTIVEDGEGYRLNGRKFFSTGALTAEWVPVYGLHRDGRIRTAYVRRDTPGLEVLEDWDAFGQRGTYSGTTVLDNVWVPKEHVVDRSLGDPAVLTTQFAGSQLLHAAIEIGGVEGVLNTAAAVLAKAELAGNPLSDHDLTRLGEFAARASAARALLLHGCRVVAGALAAAPDRDGAIAAAIAADAAKSLAYELGPLVASEVAHLLTRGTAAGKRGLDRPWRNSRTHSLHDPVRWRQFYVGDFHLNGRLAPDIASMLGR